jgi:hypothetical protein
MYSGLLDCVRRSANLLWYLAVSPGRDSLCNAEQ